MSKIVLGASGYAHLPEHFFARLDPVRVAKPRLIRFNEALAADLGLDAGALDADMLAQIFSGNVLPRGAEPIAMAYAGHQFGQFVPQLGDGRAILLGELRDRSGVRREIQLKGSGRTPFSRGGDGRAALGPVLREYLVSEAMHALGIPATRALAAVATGESVFREGEVAGAILTRVAASHVRVGTFQYFAARGDVQATRSLANHVIERHYPTVTGAEQPYLELLRGVAHRHAQLVASWMQVGFIHGVMNTDNMSVSGETLDFGPCAFMDAYDAARVFSSIDRQGRYSYANQPQAAQWNLARFAETLLPLFDCAPERAMELATEVIAEFPARFMECWLAGMRRKLGLAAIEDGDLRLAQGLLEAMQHNQADFTLTYRRLCAAAERVEADAELRTLFADPGAYDAWAVAWRLRLSRESWAPGACAAAMRQVNPAFIVRNHRIEQVIRAAVDTADFAPFAELLEVSSRPYEEQARFAAYAAAPREDERIVETFCGT